MPAPTTGRALIDTGADRTAIHPMVPRSIPSPPAGTARVRRPGGTGTYRSVDLHDVRLAIAGAPTPAIPPAWVEIEAVAVAPANPGILALIGRGMLAHSQSFYDGWRRERILVYGIEEPRFTGSRHHKRGRSPCPGPVASDPGFPAAAPATRPEGIGQGGHSGRRRAAGSEPRMGTDQERNRPGRDRGKPGKAGPGRSESRGPGRSGSGAPQSFVTSHFRAPAPFHARPGGGPPRTT